MIYAIKTIVDIIVIIKSSIDDFTNMFTIPATKIASRLIKSHIDIFERSFYVGIPITAKANKTMDVIKKILVILDSLKARNITPNVIPVKNEYIK